MIISTINNAKESGVFSQLFFVLNHRLIAQRHGTSFKLVSNEWIFKFDKGWEDYFENMDIVTDHDNDRKEIFKKMMSINEFNLYQYMECIREVYVYNNYIKGLITDKRNELNLIGDDYDSIFIRNGDKLCWESKYIPTHKYIELLLIKNPNCHTIFLQTDDYNCFLDLQKYIDSNQLNIKLYTLCHESYIGGMVIFDYGAKFKTSCLDKRNEYLSNNIDSLTNSKIISTLNPDEMKDHVTTMIVGLDIVFNSNVCVCDYQSNVGRFIKLAHKNIDNVYNVLNGSFRINMLQVICPAYAFYQ